MLFEDGEDVTEIDKDIASKLKGKSAKTA